MLICLGLLGLLAFAAVLHGAIANGLSSTYRALAIGGGSLAIIALTVLACAVAN